MSSKRLRSWLKRRPAENNEGYPAKGKAHVGEELGERWDDASSMG